MIKCKGEKYRGTAPVQLGVCVLNVYVTLNNANPPTFLSNF